LPLQKGAWPEGMDLNPIWINAVLGDFIKPARIKIVDVQQFMSIATQSVNRAIPQPILPPQARFPGVKLDREALWIID
jgi:hypothetical protein